MLKPLIVIAGLALASAAPAFAEPAADASTAAAKAAGPLTVDSPLHDLVSDPRTRPVIARRMPGFIERFETDPELQQMFGDISPSGLQHDPHARGMTPEALAKLAAELAEAQKPAAG
jgi:hypothetical protein